MVRWYHGIASGQKRYLGFLSRKISSFKHTPFFSPKPCYLMSFRRGDRDPLLSSLNASSSTSQDFYTESGAVVTAQPSPPPPWGGGSGARASQEVEVISGVRCTIQWQVDGSVVRHKLVKCQVFSGSTVDSLVNTIRSHWHVDNNASRIVEGQVRFIDYLVKEMPSSALLLPEYPAALLFSDKGSNTANIEVTFLFERVIKPCCSKRLTTWGFFSAFVTVRPVLIFTQYFYCPWSSPLLFFSTHTLLSYPSQCLHFCLFSFFVRSS